MDTLHDFLNFNSPFVMLLVNWQGNTCLHYCFTYGYGELGDYLISKVWIVMHDMACSEKHIFLNDSDQYIIITFSNSWNV